MYKYNSLHLNKLYTKGNSMRALILVVVFASAIAQNHEQRIIGGSAASTNQFPWNLSLRNPTSHTCGAVIIASNKGITAAHCMFGSSYSIRAGTNFRTEACSGNCQEREVTSSERHPNYGSGEGAFPNDIATLRWSALNFNDGIHAVEMANSLIDQGQASSDCQIAGWGRTCPTCPWPENLMYANTNVITNNHCIEFWDDNINDGHICTLAENIGPCSSDSGGPLTCYVDEVPYVFGVASWGRAGCDTTYPSAYTRISFFLTWINDN